jgi:hypothetical protein
MADKQVTIAKIQVIDEETVQKFKASLRGELIRPGDAGYDDARKVFFEDYDGAIEKFRQCTIIDQ